MVVSRRSRCGSRVTVTVSTPYKSGMVVSRKGIVGELAAKEFVSTPYKSGMVLSPAGVGNTNPRVSKEFQPPINRGWCSHYFKTIIASLIEPFEFQPPINRGWCSHGSIGGDLWKRLRGFQPPINRGWCSHVTFPSSAVLDDQRFNPL